jgi:hypothetical protein
VSREVGGKNWVVFGENWKDNEFQNYSEINLNFLKGS